MKRPLDEISKRIEEIERKQSTEGSFFILHSLLLTAGSSVFGGSQIH